MLKVGDKVIFTGKTCRYKEVRFTASMREIVIRDKGKVFTVLDVYTSTEGTAIYTLKGVEWVWTDEWIKKAPVSNTIGGVLNEKTKSKA